jgi:hypothetical protein
VAGDDPVLDLLRDQFPRPVRVGGAEFFEASDITVVLITHPTSDEVTFTACVVRPIPEERVPACLVDMCLRSELWGTGVFFTIRRRVWDEHRRSLGLPPLQDDEIPF